MDEKDGYAVSIFAGIRKTTIRVHRDESSNGVKCLEYSVH